MQNEFLSAQTSLDILRDEYDRKQKLLNDNFFRALVLKKQEYDSQIRNLTMAHIADGKRLNDELEAKVKDLKTTYVDLP